MKGWLLVGTYFKFFLPVCAIKPLVKNYLEIVKLVLNVNLTSRYCYILHGKGVKYYIFCRQINTTDDLDLWPSLKLVFGEFDTHREFNIKVILNFTWKKK